ncbi:uL15 family ribosomal protein [archaeon]|nr:uL15 family ribosomal protein [archaeon]
MAKIQVNLWKISKNTQKGDTILVLGKVLGDGNLDHPVNIAAESFSESAKKKIESAGGKIISKQDAEKAKARLMK